MDAYNKEMVSARMTRRSLGASGALLCLVAVGAGVIVSRGNVRPANSRPRAEEHVRRGTPGYSAPIDILATPVKFLGAPGWDSERLWSKHVDWEPAIAADPGAAYIYQLTTRYDVPACDGCADPAIVFRRSSDSGRTWDDGVYPAPVPGSQHDPQIEVALDGTIYAAYLQGLRPGVVFQKSSDLGVSWTNPKPIRGKNGPRWSDKPWLVISDDGRDVYIGFNSSDSYVVASHNYGRTFKRPHRTSRDSRYWFHTGGAVAPNGEVYLAAVDYSQTYEGHSHINVLKSTDGGGSWSTHHVDTSREMADCPWARGCYFGFLGPSASLAMDVSGTIMIAYNAGDVPGGAQQIWARTSDDGIRWSARKRISTGSTPTNSAFPALAAGPDRGDFRLVWQDDRKSPTRRWNTWYRRTVDGGRSWGKTVRLSGVRSGTSYKAGDGYGFPYGDYLEMAVDGEGANYVIWREGESFDGNGGTWFTRGQ